MASAWETTSHLQRLTRTCGGPTAGDAGDRLFPCSAGGTLQDRANLLPVPIWALAPLEWLRCKDGFSEAGVRAIIEPELGLYGGLFLLCPGDDRQALICCFEKQESMLESWKRGLELR